MLLLKFYASSALNTWIYSNLLLIAELQLIMQAIQSLVHQNLTSRLTLNVHPTRGVTKHRRNCCFYILLAEFYGVIVALNGMN